MRGMTPASQRQAELLRGGAQGWYGPTGILGVTLLAAAMLVAGCGAGSSNQGVASLAAPTTTAGSATVQRVGRAGAFGLALAFAQCMRTHGEPNFPEPVRTGNAVHEALRAGSGVDPNSPQFTAARTACKHLLPNNGFPGPSAGPAFTPAERADYLKAAACLRSRKVPDFPDPTFQGDSVMFRSRTPIDTSTPQYNSALATCRKLIPAGLPYSSSGGP
jgi:hypothetical protein